jgi:hypothetical protein
MFCPVGYLPFVDVLDDCGILASSAFSAETLRRGRDVKSPSGEIAAKRWLMVRPLLKAWLLSKALTEYSVYAASPRGEVVLLSGWMLDHLDLLNWYDWEWPDLDDYQGELRGPLNRYMEDEKQDPLSRFLFIDCWTGSVSVSARIEKIGRWATEEGEDYLALTRIASQIDDWVICFDGNEVPKGIDDFASGLSFHHPRLRPVLENSPEKPRKGRPSKVHPVAEIYKAEFPDGHRGLLREEVRRRVEATGKIAVSLDTLDKAIRLVSQENGLLE